MLARMDPRHRDLIAGVGLGAAYGLLAFVGFRELDALPTASFLFGVPAALGLLSLAFTDPEQRRNYLWLLAGPWHAALGALALIAGTTGESLFCLVLFALPFVGGALAVTTLVWAVRGLRLRARRRAAAAAALLPFLLAPLEQRFAAEAEVGEVRDAVVVEAPAAEVWPRLAEVPAIGEDEYPPSPLDRLGVPRPVRATVDRAALGGHRVGEFTHGLRFEETIVAFEPERRMTFDVRVDPERLRPHSAERHAFERGYFRFLDATYTLEPLGPGRTRLALASRHVLTTSVNGYGRLWARAVTSDFQRRVLAVLKARLERDGRARLAAGEPAGGGRR
jgi:hypothetical protein